MWSFAHLTVAIISAFATSVYLLSLCVALVAQPAVALLCNFSNLPILSMIILSMQTKDEIC